LFSSFLKVEVIQSQQNGVKNFYTCRLPQCQIKTSDYGRGRTEVIFKFNPVFLLEGTGSGFYSHMASYSETSNNNLL
jgi:hypothetical protein